MYYSLIRQWANGTAEVLKIGTDNPQDPVDTIYDLEKTMENQDETWHTARYHVNRHKMRIEAATRAIARAMAVADAWGSLSQEAKVCVKIQAPRLEEALQAMAKTGSWEI